MVEVEQPLDSHRELKSIQRWRRIQAGTLDEPLVHLTADEEAETQPSEQVIHRRVKLVALEPAPRITPNLTHNVGVRIDLLHPVPKLGPETVVVDLPRDI